MFIEQHGSKGISEHFPCVWPGTIRSLFAFAKFIVRMAGIKGTKPIRTRDPSSTPRWNADFPNFD